MLDTWNSNINIRKRAYSLRSFVQEWPNNLIYA